MGKDVGVRKREPLTAEREAAIRRDVEEECSSPTEALLLDALDATRAELAEVRAQLDTIRGTPRP